MIISASYKTDIPAFCAEWFAKRLRAGHCKMVNAYNHAQQRRVSMRPEDVAGFVFWTKNIAPFRPALAEVAARGVPFVVQYTINPYPPSLQPAVHDSRASVELARELASTYGPRVVVWRYDPILFSDLTPPAYHLHHFAELARHLRGVTNEVVVKFANLYRKTRRNLRRAAGPGGFAWWDPPRDEKRALLRQLADLADDQGLTLRLCAQPELLTDGVEPSICIDGRRLSDVAGHPIATVAKGVRPGCQCAAAIDIGEYDTCPHGCIYCYAVDQHRSALRRHQTVHDPNAEYLIVPTRPGTDSDQLSLF